MSPSITVEVCDDRFVTALPKARMGNGATVGAASSTMSVGDSKQRPAHRQRDGGRDVRDAFFNDETRARELRRRACVTTGRARFLQKTVARARSRSYIRDQLHNSCKRGYRVIQLRRRVPLDRSIAAATTFRAARDVAASIHTIDQDCRLSGLRAFDT
jgi:hypothetical protein